MIDLGTSKQNNNGGDPYLLLEEVLLLSVYPGLQLPSPLVTVGDILADEFEESFGEVVKFRDGVVLDLVSKKESKRKFQRGCEFPAFNVVQTEETFFFFAEGQYKHLLGMGGLSGPRAILILALDNKNLEINKPTESQAWKPELLDRDILSSLSNGR